MIRDANRRPRAMTAPSSRRPLALTMGDPAGIGPELPFAPGSRALRSSSPFFALADPKALGALARRLGLKAPIAEVSPAEASAAFARALPVVALSAPADARPGEPDPTFAAADDRIDRARRRLRPKRAKRARSSPIRSPRRRSIAAGFKFPGHTEFLGELAAALGRAGAAGDDDLVAALSRSCR